jgi:IclR family acetate operon transcriptional repressor
VRQARKQGDYVLTTKVVSLGLGFLSSAGIVDIAEPLLERWPQPRASWCACPSSTRTA